MPTDKVSINIPTLNEEKMLPVIFKNLKDLHPRPLEIIFVDGPSKDETSGMILAKGYQLIRSIAKGRALQMNEGAFQAKGDVLFFFVCRYLGPQKSYGYRFDNAR